jgi:hypothetical protein
MAYTVCVSCRPSPQSKTVSNIGEESFGIGNLQILNILKQNTYLLGVEICSDPIFIVSAQTCMVASCELSFILDISMNFWFITKLRIPGKWKQDMNTLVIQIVNYAVFTLILINIKTNQIPNYLKLLLNKSTRNQPWP